MAGLTQQHRWLKVTTSLGPDAFLLTRFQGVESISEAFEYALDLATSLSTKVPFDKLLGQPVTVEMKPVDGPSRYFHGLMRSIEEVGSDNTFRYYRAEVVPRFWMLKLTTDSRVWQRQTAIDILHTVLDGIDTAYNTSDTYLPHNYCVQYRESYFAFANRLMEEEGIYYFFEHTSKGHQLILADNSPHSPSLPGQDRFRFDRVEGGAREQARIYRWKTRQAIVSGGHVLWDRNFQLPRQNLEAIQHTVPSVKVGQGEYQFVTAGDGQPRMYDYPGGFAHRFDGIDSAGGDRPTDIHNLFEANGSYARLAMRRETCQALTVEGASNSPLLIPGYKFTLAGHSQADGDYVLLAVEHYAEQPAAQSSGDDAPSVYRNTFRCLPADLPYCPPRKTPEPRIHGTQTATVVGPPGEKIFTDKYGRVKVQFHWDRLGKNNADSSCWVRVSQPSAGGNWGHIVLPRIGHEVVVSFLEGDPDRPLITGSVYNPDQMPPFPLPQNRTQSGFKTRSKNGGAANFSGIAFEDQDGSEHLQLHAERDMTHSSENNHYINVGQEHHTNVGRFITSRVGGLPYCNHAMTSGSGTGAGYTLATASPPTPLTAMAVDSGSGGEGESEDDSSGQEGPFCWTAEVFGGIAGRMNLTMGVENEGVIGMTDEVIVGVEAGTVINPFGILFGMVHGHIEGVASGLAKSLLENGIMGNELSGLGQGACMGYTEIVYGSTTEIGVGPKIDISFGNTWEIHAHNSSAGTKLAGALYAIMQAASPALGMLERNWAGDLADAALNLMPLMTLDCWTALASLDSLKSQAENVIKAAVPEFAKEVQKKIDRNQANLQAATEAINAANEQLMLLSLASANAVDEELRASFQADIDAVCENMAAAEAMRDEALASDLRPVDAAELTEQLTEQYATVLESKADSAIATLVLAGLIDAIVVATVLLSAEDDQSTNESGSEESGGDTNNSNESPSENENNSGGGAGWCEFEHPDSTGNAPIPRGSGSGSGLVEEAAILAFRNEHTNADYQLGANSITMTATPAYADAGTLVSIVAAGNPGISGNVEIAGTRNVMLSAGPLASLLIETVGEADCGIAGIVAPTGTITFQTGVDMEPAGMSINGELGITLRAATEISLQVDEAMVKMTPAGIILSVGDSSIGITPEGIEINGPVINITADGECSIESGEFNVSTGDISIEGGAVEAEVGDVNLASGDFNVEAALVNFL